MGQLSQITFPVGPLACNCTILGDNEAGEAIVIDPGDQVGGIVAHLEKHGWKLTAILVTHAHIDHIGGAAELKRRTGAPVWMHPEDAALYSAIATQASWIGVPPPAVTAIDAPLIQSARLALGGAALQVLETPGHTQGSVCLYLPAESKLFAGDTLFAGSIGRTDLPGGDSRRILQSLHSVVLALPDATLVIPGHGPATTIGEERRTNPFLQPGFRG